MSTFQESVNGKQVFTKTVNSYVQEDYKNSLIQV